MGVHSGREVGWHMRARKLPKIASACSRKGSSPRPPSSLGRVITVSLTRLRLPFQMNCRTRRRTFCSKSAVNGTTCAANHSLANMQVLASRVRPTTDSLRSCHRSAVAVISLSSRASIVLTSSPSDENMMPR